VALKSVRLNQYLPYCEIEEHIMVERAKCGCGRSPTGFCIGWHSLSDEDYQAKKKEYDERQAKAADKDENQ
jgi:hypothetical protein